MFGIPELTQSINNQTAEVRKLRIVLAQTLDFLQRESRPGKPALHVTPKQEIDMDLIVFGVTADAPAAADVVTRKLSVTVDGVATDKEYSGSTTEFDDVKVEEGKDFVISLVDVDNAGNESPPATLSGTAVDTFAPAAAGGLGMTVKGEEHV